MQPVTSPRIIPANQEDYPKLPLTGERFAVRFGPKVPVTVSAGDGETGPAVFIVTPPTPVPAGVGFAYELSQDDAVQLGAAIYATLPDVGRLRFVAALGQSREK